MSEGVYYQEVVGGQERLFIKDQTHLQVESATEPKLTNLDASKGTFWINTSVQTINARAPAGVNFPTATFE